MYLFNLFHNFLLSKIVINKYAKHLKVLESFSEISVSVKINSVCGLMRKWTDGPKTGQTAPKILSFPQNL